MPEYMKKEKRTFMDIVYETIQDIEKKSLIEFRGGQKKTIIHGNLSETIIEPDSRKEVIQAIEFLYDLLYSTINDKESYPPRYKRYFGTIKKETDKIMGESEKILKEFEGEKLDREKYVIQKVRLMKKLFRSLMDVLLYTKLGKGAVLSGEAG